MKPLQKNQIWTILTAVLIFLTVFGVNFAVHHDEYPAWDAAAYLVTGDFFFGKTYLYDDPRPPVIPLVWGLFAFLTKNLIIMGVFDIILRALSCVVVFFFARKYLTDVSAFLLAMLTGISIVSLRIPLFFSEFVALIFLLISLEQLIKLDQRKASNFELYTLLFLFAGLAVLTRYPMAVYCFVIILVFVENWRVVKNTAKELILGMAIASIPLILWGIWNLSLLGNPFTSSTQSLTAVSNDQFAMPWHYYVWTSPENIFVLLTIAIPILVYGMYAAWNSRMRAIVFLPMFFLIFQTYIPGKLTRYMFFVLFFSYFLVFYGVEKISEKNKLPWKNTMLLTAFIILMLPMLYTNPSNENWKGKEFYHNGLTLRQITPEDAVLLSEFPTQIAYAAERRTYTLISDVCTTAACPTYPLGLKKIYGCEKVDYVVSDKPLQEICLKDYYINATQELYVYSFEN